MPTKRRSLLQLLGFAIPYGYFAVCFAGTAPAQTDPAHEPVPADLTGKWQFVFDTEGGPRTYEADFRVDGQTVTGTWDKKPNVKGTFTDGKLDLEFPTTSDEVGDGTLKITGRLTDVLTGTWSFQTYAGTFKASRLKG